MPLLMVRAATPTDFKLIAMLAIWVSCCRLTFRQMLVGCQQQATALAAVHRKGMVHHDFRMGNILVSPAADAWLLSDFGNAAPATLDGAPNIVTEAL